MANIHIGNISKKEKVLINALKSPINFGQMFLPKDFLKETASKYHYEVASIMDDKKNLKPTIFMLPRGHAKTKLTQASILKDIVTYRYDDEIIKEPFIVWVAQNKTQSMRNVNFVKHHIETNSRLKYYFGDLRNVGRGKWTQEELDFANDASLICRAGIHGIRGLLKDNLRPNRFVLDDFEYEGNVKTQHSRDMNSATVTSVILPALDPRIGRLQINQTPVHYDSFIVRINDAYLEHINQGGTSDDFQWIVYKKATTLENPLWPEYFDKKQLYRTKQTLKQAGEIHKWYQEYEMEVSSDETSLFGRKVIKYYDGNLIKEGGNMFLHVTSIEGKPCDKKLFVYTFQGCDPASDIETRTSSYTAFIGLAVDYDGNYYCTDIYRKKNMPDIALQGADDKYGIANKVLDFHISNGCKRSGVEKHAISSGVFNGIKGLKLNYSHYQNCAITPLSHEGIPKLDRIYNRLVNIFNGGQFFIKESHGALEKEIEQFGEYAKTLDLLDAAEMAVRVSYKPKEEIKQEPSIKKDPWEIDQFYDAYNYQNWKTI